MRAFIDKAGHANMTSDNPKMKPWRQQIGWTALSARTNAGLYEPFAKGVALTITCRFFLARPKSAPMLRVYPTVKPDTDKLLRAVGDALKGVLYVDDAQVVSWRGHKRYNVLERAEIEVEVLL
jgi:Holliday junction resolvase RusA-like endonuclease